MKSISESRFFYFCTINTPKYENKVGHQVHIGAATSKAISIVTALRYCNLKGYLISLPIIGKDSTKKTMDYLKAREGKTPIYFLPTKRDPFFRRIHGIFTAIIFAIKKIKNKDTVIIYNYPPEYFLMALFLYVKGNPVILDIEDAPLLKSKKPRELINNIFFFLFKIIARKKYLTVSKEISKNLEPYPTCIVYGAYNDVSVKLTHKDNEYVILYGGSLQRETGLYIFGETIRTLVTLSLPKKIRFIVTGFTSDEKYIKYLEELIINTSITIENKINSSQEEYQKILPRCNAALVLKMPQEVIGSTTFPSKVVELTFSGLLLITTKVSDIPFIFTSDSAIFLDEATPNYLTKSVLWVLNHPEQAKQIALSGRNIALDNFSYPVVANRLKYFLLEDHE